MKILGVNLAKQTNGKHVYDGSAVLLIDGVVFGAIAEERLNRKKYSGGYECAVEYLLKKAGIQIKDVDLVVTSCYGEEPKLELFGELGFESAKNLMMIPSHHLSHAYSAYFPSQMTEALILVADNEGNILGEKRHKEIWKNSLERVSIFHGYNTRIDLLEYDMDGENVVSLGELYSALTHFLGFESYQNAGKTMAIAAYGDLKRFKDVPFIEHLPDGRFFCPLNNNYTNTNQELQDYLSNYNFNLRPLDNNEPITPIYKDLAATIQNQLENALIHKLQYWTSKTKIKNICLAGGIALNCVANYRIAKTLKLNHIFIPSNPGDQGLALGNALYGWYHCFDNKTLIDCKSPYLGCSYDSKTYSESMFEFGNEITWTKDLNVVKTTAELIAKGKIVAVFQGKSEWGPRALGNRSILADPTRSYMKDQINSHIKHREIFRPFAPIVPIEAAGDYFENEFSTALMTIAVPIKEHQISNIPAVSHVDGTARVQTVDSSQNPFLYALLKEFGLITGVEVLLNTSFNDNNEPIVESPRDAIKSFLTMEGIDILILETYIIERVRR